MRVRKKVYKQKLLQIELFIWEIFLKDGGLPVSPETDPLPLQKVNSANLLLHGLSSDIFA